MTGAYLIAPMTRLLEVSTFGEACVNRAAMRAIQIPTRRVGGLIEGEQFGPIECEGNAAQRGATITLSAEGRIGHGGIVFGGENEKRRPEGRRF